jgi:hypothetical protein
MGQFEETFKQEEIITKFGDKNRASERTEIIYELAVARSRSFGLRTMFERISSTGGKFSIKSTPGAGTKIQARVPIKKKG